MDEPLVTEPQSATHPVLSLVAALFWALLWILSCIRSLVAFATISVPRFIYAILSYSLTFTLNFWSFVVIFLASAVALNYWIRFRYLNTYAKLKEPPLVKPDAKELHPDVNAPEVPPNFHNYLDDFLQAVRIFGFLEKPVFHELARHLQTRRLIAGDSLSLDQDKSFYCVVDGLVQVYTETSEGLSEQGSWDEGIVPGYQLLNEVGSGGTLSSLFMILSLFTEDVRISWQDTDVSDPGPDMDILHEPSRTRSHRSNSDVSLINLDAGPSRTHSRRHSISSSASTAQTDTTILSPSSSSKETYRKSKSGSARARPIHHGTVAVAVEDSTLAVIPAEAFRRVTKKYPKSSAHIVQVILTRFARVTINAAHKYLGLTTEVLRTEKAINDIACHPLPARFYEGGGLQQLRQRFDRGAREASPNTDEEYVPVVQSPKADSETLQSVFDDLIAESPRTPFREMPSLSRMHSSRQFVQAGDLLSSTGSNETYHGIHRSSTSTIKDTKKSHSNLSSPVNQLQDQGRRLAMDDFDLRDEVMSCIAKSIGLHQPPLSGTDSIEASPAFSATEHSKAAPIFSSYGSLSLLETGDDASSVAASSSAAGAPSNIGALDNEVEILFFTAGSTLARAGEHHPGLFYVIDGILDISLPMEEDNKSEEDASKDATTPRGLGLKIPLPGNLSGKEKANSKRSSKHLFTVKPGGIAGYMASLCGIPSYVDITAKMDTYVGFLPYRALERLLEKRPIVQLTLAKRLISLLSPLVLHVDASLDWMQIGGGQVLWRPGEISDSFYIVINGRLRAIDDREDGKVIILDEYGQGDPVGELDVITRSRRRNTVHAIRDTELVRMPLTLFNAISARNPQATARLLRLIASRVRDELDSSNTSRPKMMASELRRSSLNLKTVAILPYDRTIPVELFAKKLQTALESVGAPTAYLNQASLSRHLGRHAFTRMGKLKVAGWLADQEQRYRTVLYVVDSPVNSTWTQTCIRQADCVMVIGAGDDPTLGEYERLLQSIKTTARKELVLLHPDRSVAPGLTREWLKIRPWIHQHIHVELPGLVTPVTKPIPLPQDPTALIAFRNFKDRVQSEIQKIRTGRSDSPRPQRPPHMNDFARLARRICGKSIGLVLGGGGARGMAHLGVIRALTEFGIPIDHIGGTSIGSFVGGLYAKEGDILSASGRAKQFSSRMGNIWRILSDVTYPIVAYTTGHEFNRSIYKSFYDLHIEDMWLPFFCNTTNILTSQMTIHETGYAWRFIRASMTLVGLLPPLCDNGNMLVDGGYLDNLPVSTMQAMGARAVFACDVGSLDDNSPRNFGDTVSGWWLLISRLNPFSNAKQIPPITEIQSRLAYVSSVKTLEEAKSARGCFYMQMPVQEFGTLQFGKFEEIAKRGYEAAVQLLEKWDEEGKLSAILEDASGSQSFAYPLIDSISGPRVNHQMAEEATVSEVEIEEDQGLDVSLLRELGKNSLINALNSVNGAKTLVLDPSVAGPLSLLIEVALLKQHGVDKMFWLEPGPLASTTTNVVYLTRPKIKWAKLIAEQIKQHAREGQRHNYTLFLVPRLSTMISRVLEEEGVLGEVNISSFNMQFIPIADDVISLEHEQAFKEIWVDGDETIVYDSAQAFATFQKLYGTFPRIIGKGDSAGRLSGLLQKQLDEAEVTSSPETNLTGSTKIDSLVVLDRRVDMITPMLTQLTYEGLIDEMIGIKNSYVELPSSLLTVPNPQSSQGSSSSTGSSIPSSSVLAKDSKKKHHLNAATDALFGELRDLNFSSVGKRLNRTARRLEEDYKSRHQAKSVAQLREFVGKLSGLQTEHQSLRIHTGLSEMLVPLTRTEQFNKALEIQQNLLSSYEISNQVSAIEDLIAQGANMQLVLRLLCLASIISGGVKSKSLESLEREVLQSYGYEYLPVLLSLTAPPLCLLHPNPLPASLTSLASTRLPYSSLKKSLRLLTEEPDDADEPHDISYVYSGYAPLSVRLVQCVVQKGGVLNAPGAGGGDEGLKRKADARSEGVTKVRAHPIIGWKGFEDVVNSIPGETVDIVRSSGTGEVPVGPAAALTGLFPSEKTSTTVVFFLGGCTYTEIAALRWVSRQMKGRRILIATTSVVSGASLVNSIASTVKGHTNANATAKTAESAG